MIEVKNDNFADLLIIVDMQNDFIDGSLGSKEAQEILPGVINRVNEYVDADIPIAFTRDTHPKNYLNTFEGKHLPVKHCIKGTDGWLIADALNQAVCLDNAIITDALNQAVCLDDDNIIFIDKPTFAYMNWPQVFNTIAERFERGIYSVELCGLCTDICVISNALVIRGWYHDMPIRVNADLCAGVTPERHKAALTVMQSCQIDVINADKYFDN